MFLSLALSLSLSRARSLHAQWLTPSGATRTLFMRPKTATAQSHAAVVPYTHAMSERGWLTGFRTCIQ